MKNSNDVYVKFTPEFEAELKKGPVNQNEREQIIHSISKNPDKTECDQAFFKIMGYNARLYLSKNKNADPKEEKYMTADDIPACKCIK